jgi:hypothetical protein
MQGEPSDRVVFVSQTHFHPLDKSKPKHGRKRALCERKQARKNGKLLEWFTLRGNDPPNIVGRIWRLFQSLAGFNRQGEEWKTGHRNDLSLNTSCFANEGTTT